VLVDGQFDFQHLVKFNFPEINPFEMMTEFVVVRENMPSPNKWWLGLGSHYTQTNNQINDIETVPKV